MEGEDNKRTQIPVSAFQVQARGKSNFFNPHPKPLIQTNTHPGSLPGPHILQGLWSFSSLQVWDFLLSTHPHLPDAPSVGGFPA